MTPEQGDVFWRVVLVATAVVASSLLLPPLAGEAVCAVIVVAAVILMIRRRRNSNSTIRLATVGCVLIGVAPVVTEAHRALGAGDLFSVGDVTAIVGYLFTIAAVHRLGRLRTVDRQPHVILDALSITAWLSLIVGFLTIEDIQDAFSGWDEAMVLAYAPFTLLLVFVMLRLSLGSGDRSGAFVLLVSAASFAVISEIMFLESAVGNDAARQWGVTCATIALVFFTAAFFHPSADGLEEPHPGAIGQTSNLLAGAIGGSTVLVVLLAFLVELRPFEVAILVVLGVITAARSVLVVQERDEWLGLQRTVADYATAVADVEDRQLILDQGIASAEAMLTGRQLLFVDLQSESDLDELLFEASDPAGAEINEVDGDLWRALDTGLTQRTESTDGSRRGYQSRLAIPIDSGIGERHVMVIEAAPVLSMTEISHLELLASGIGRAVAVAAARQQGQLERADRRFRSLVQDSNDVLMLVDTRTLETQLISPTVERLLGYSEEECLGAHPLQFVMVEDGARLLTSLESAAGHGNPLDLRLVHKNGQTRWFATTVRELCDDDELSGYVVSLSDIHDRKMAELQLGMSERRYRSLVESSREIFAVVDDDLMLSYVSPNVERLLGVPAASVVGSNVLDMVAPESAEDANDLVDLPEGAADGRTIELQLVTGPDSSRWFEVTVTERSVDEQGWVLTARDVHARHELQQSLERAALHDELTGLSNRSSFQFELNQRLQSLGAGQSVGVLHLDVKDFKVVNESLGLEVGDELLVAIAGRIRSVLRRDDLLARFGADSFGVLATVTSPGSLEAIARHIAATFSEPFEIVGRRWSVAMSIGIASTSDRRSAAVTVLEEAVLALRQAKSSEANAPVAFDPRMREVAHERFELESDLLPGLAAGEFHVVFQPLLRMASQQVSSVEALLRWNHPQRGPVSPGAFIPVAEHSGAIVELGRWVLEESCRRLVDWHQRLPDARGLGVSVNLSVRQLVKDGEFERLTKIILDSGVDPARVTLELTESLVINEVPLVRRGIEAMRALGISIAVDDFGSGTAGLNHLRDVPFDILKIDKSYVDPLGAGNDAYQLLASVVELAHAMGAKVVAEGIETPEQARLLREMGCDTGQGFYLGRPMDPPSLEDWFAAGREGTVAAQIVQPVS